MAKDQSLVVDIKELAALLSISKGTCYSLARRNELPVPVIRIGQRRVVCSRSAVADLIAQRKTGEKQP